MKLIGPQLKRVGVLLQYGKYVSTVLDNAIRELDEKSSTCLLGAIAGALIESIYEFATSKSTDFLLFTPSSLITDDSILTLAVADAILNKGSYRDRIQE